MGQLTLGLWLGPRVQEPEPGLSQQGGPSSGGGSQAGTCSLLRSHIIQRMQGFGKSLYCGRSRPGSGAEKSWPSTCLESTRGRDKSGVPPEA